MSTQTVMIGLLVLAGLGVVSVFGTGARIGARAGRGTREVTRLGWVALHVLVGTVVIGGTQWALLARFGAPGLWAVVLGLPALLAAVTVARLLAVTAVVRTVRSRR